MKHSLRNVIAVLTPALLAGPLLGQAASSSSTASSGGSGDEIIEISPFVVTTNADAERVTETTSGTLVSRPLEKLPMGITVVGSELMKQLDIFNADSLNMVVPGLANQNNTSSEGTGNNTQYASRGFTVLPRLDGFAPGGRLFDMTAIDRVEVIRGPNSLLYGQSDPGGIINYISKRAHIRDAMAVHGSASVAVGNFAFRRGEIDVDTSLIPKVLAIRLPASYTTNEREFNWYKNRVTSINPTILYRILPNTELSFTYEYLDVKTNFAAFQPMIWTPPGGVEYVDKNKRGLGVSYNPFGPYAHAENIQHNWILDLTSRINDHITFRGAYSDNKRDRNELTPTGGDPFRVTPAPYRGQDVIDGNHIKGYKGDLLLTYDLGPVTTRTVLGYEYNDNVFFSTVYQGWRNGAWDNFMTLNVGYDPATGLATHIPSISDYKPFPNETLDPNYWKITGGPAKYESKWTNKRISEVLSAFDDRLQALGGVARGTSTLVNLTNNSEDSRQANVYQIGLGAALDKRKQHMVFVNRSTSYQPQFLFDVNYDPLPPTTAKGTEGGIKSTWGNTGLHTTLTVFTQERTNVGRQFTDYDLNRTYGVLTPGEKSNGFEGEVYYDVNAHWNVTGLYSQFHGFVTGTPPGKSYLLGRELPRAPTKSANLFVTYKSLDQGPIRGLRVTLGANYRNSTWLDVGQGQNTLNTRRSDNGTTLFAVISKEFKLEHGRALAVRVNLGNLLDRSYITEGFTYGEERTIRVATDFKF